MPVRQTEPQGEDEKENDEPVTEEATVSSKSFQNQEEAQFVLELYEFLLAHQVQNTSTIYSSP